MSKFSNPLNNVRVAAPCSADWEQMIGNDFSRFCGQCNLNVYNLSSMTQTEAEHFIASSEGRPCVRFYRRADGSILTRNCPVGLRALQRRVSSFTRALIAAALSFLTGMVVFEGFSASSTTRHRPIMGEIAIDRSKFPLPTPPVQKAPVPILGRILPRTSTRAQSDARRRAAIESRL